MSDGGLGSLQFILASALALVVFVALANLVVVQYGRGAIQSALDQGARAATVTGSELDCETKAREVIGQLLGGAMGDGVVIDCVVGGALTTVSGEATFPSWTPFAPDFTVSLSAVATMEPS